MSYRRSVIIRPSYLFVRFLFFVLLSLCYTALRYFCPSVLLSYFPIILDILSFCPSVLLSSCSTVLLSYVLSLPLSYSPIVLLSYLLSFCPTNPIALLSNCPTVVIAFCPTILMSFRRSVIFCPTFLVCHCSILLSSFCPTVHLFSSGLLSFYSSRKINNKACYPVSECVVGGWISIWFNISTVVFLSLFNIPGIGEETCDDYVSKAFFRWVISFFVDMQQYYA